MKILVTGGAGFIGSHLVAGLLRAGHLVTVLDDFSSGKRENLPRRHPQLRVVRGDVADSEVLRGCLGGQEAVFHLAAIASVVASLEDPITTNRTNLAGTVRLLETARQAEVKRFIYASSAAVYGDVPDLPLREGGPVNPLTPYAIDKLAGERYLAYYHRSTELAGVCFRFFNVFGPRQDPSSPYSGVISIFMERAARGVPATIYGDGRQSRDFVFVGDVVRLLQAGLQQPKGGTLPIYNLGRGVSSDLLGLVAVVERVTGRPLEIEFAPARPGDVRHSLAAVERLEEAFGWRPGTSLEEGLRAIS